ncbi:MAG: cation:proton antiporter [Verrucomicrobia bacterium]|jgi:Kef-type K+ transport system membrane component KefB|nr:cation:proton antiporter [Verrucomicrobiota bacterium]
MIDYLPSWLPIEVHQTTLSIILMGVILSVSIFSDALARRTRVPRISILVLVGVGIAFVQQVCLADQDARLLDGISEPLIKIALVMVAFLLGNELTMERLRVTGPLILVISLFVIAVGGFMVGAGLLMLGFPLVVAISLAAVSVATDPAAVSETVRESGDTSLRARVLLGIVAIDDAWGIVVFGLSMVVLGWVLSSNGQLALLHALWELGGAIIIGAVIGLPAAWLTGRLRPGEPTQVEAISLILLLAGFSSLLGVSALLASMVAGTLVANLSSHHTRSFREIELIEWPFIVFLFVLSGASIDLYNVGNAIGLTVAYIILRLVGRVFGGFLAVLFIRAEYKKLPRNIGLGLTPQAGIAIGMALLAAVQFPEIRDTIVPVVIVSTIVFELIGPMLVRRVLNS